MLSAIARAYSREVSGNVNGLSYFARWEYSRVVLRVQGRDAWAIRLSRACWIRFVRNSGFATTAGERKSPIWDGFVDSSYFMGRSILPDWGIRTWTPFYPTSRRTGTSARRRKRRRCVRSCSCIAMFWSSIGTGSKWLCGLSARSASPQCWQERKYEQCLVSWTAFAISSPRFSMVLACDWRNVLNFGSRIWISSAVRFWSVMARAARTGWRCYREP